ncbi:hypothetical protein DL767_008593 [Monosporascus sp. MG133]|nr:hypothetical protein DL767_008593 [Monosporascus sp. MG133]
MRSEANQMVRDREEQNGRFPPSSPRLHWAEYVLAADSFDQDEDSLKFYLACERGITPDVISFIGSDTIPGNRSSANMAWNWLLLVASLKCQDQTTPSGDTSDNVCIFDKADGGDEEGSLISLLQAFIDVGSWHLN